MTDSTLTATAFYTERVPAHFNRTFEDQASRNEPDEVLVEGMRNVDATIQVVVSGEAGGTYYLNIAAGRMAPGDAPTHTPFISLEHGADSFAVLAHESGDSILGFLGGIVGLGDDMKLTTRTVENLAGLNGSLRFVLTGEGGFELLGRFGRADGTDDPDCTLRLDRKTYTELKTGALSTQDAFLGGRVEVEGNMEMAISLALAAISPY